MKSRFTNADQHINNPVIFMVTILVLYFIPVSKKIRLINMSLICNVNDILMILIYHINNINVINMSFN